MTWDHVTAFEALWQPATPPAPTTLTRCLRTPLWLWSPCTCSPGWHQKGPLHETVSCYNVCQGRCCPESSTLLMGHLLLALSSRWPPHPHLLPSPPSSPPLLTPLAVGCRGATADMLGLACEAASHVLITHYTSQVTEKPALSPAHFLHSPKLLPSQVATPHSSAFTVAGTLEKGKSQQNSWNIWEDLKKGVR